YHVTAVEPGVGAAAVEGELVGDIAGRVVVDEVCALGERLVQGEDGGQHLVVDVDEFDRPARGLRVPGGDGGGLVAHVPHVLEGQRIQVGTEGTPLDLGGVGAGDHGVHAGQALGTGGVEAQDPGAGVRRAQDGAVQHAREPAVGRVDGVPGHLL